jgi:uncharacterized delta-60 repeat protein
MLAGVRRRFSLTILGTLSLVLATANPAAAPPGDLDSTFDGDGKVITDFAGGFDQAQAVAIQGDGKIVAAGLAPVSGNDDFGLARYNTDGSTDPTFDGDGRVTTDIAAGFDEAFDVAIQADGKIVAAGFAFVSGTLDFAIARYHTDGSLDPTFDGDGTVTADFAGNTDLANAVDIQSDGKIVVAGTALFSGTDDFALARYNVNGSLDFTFDGDGKVTTDFFSTRNQANAMSIQADGKIVAAGCVDCAGTVSDYALARYNTDGSLDTTFDGDGKVTTGFVGGYDEAFSTGIQADGKILAAGYASVSGQDDFALARYNADGSLDSGFDGDGKVTTDFAGNTDRSLAMAIQADGRIVAAGRSTFSGNIDFALARYSTSGSLDTVFSGDGRLTTDFAGDFDQANGVAIQADRKIVAAGFARISGADDFALARYTVCRRTSRPTSIPICP